MVLALSLVLGAAAAHAQRWDHRGSLGLLTGVGVDGRSSIGVGQSDSGVRLFPELGGTLALSERLSLKAAGRLFLLGPQLGLAFLGGIRSSFGARFKTFFDLDLTVHVVPIVTIGPRVGFGVQYELLDVLGVFAVAALQFGVGPQGARIGGELLIGLQFRSYLFD